jgi:hypothetical protein
MSTPVSAEEVWALFAETDRRFKETDRKFQETERFLREIGQQIGGFGKKFGSFTEGLALPSLERLLTQRFGMDVVSPSVRLRKGGEHVELDLLAYANGEVNTAVVVEVKSHVREDSLQQLLRELERFPDWFPEHRDKHLFGILAGVDFGEPMRQATLRAGVYPAWIHDEIFEMVAPPDFVAWDFRRG